MKTSFTILLLVGLLAGYQLTQSQDSPPRFEANATVLISEVAEGIRSEFVLRNEDTKPKMLTLKGTSCHCVGVSVNGEDLAQAANVDIAGVRIA